MARGVIGDIGEKKVITEKQQKYITVTAYTMYKGIII